MQQAWVRVDLDAARVLGGSHRNAEDGTQLLQAVLHKTEIHERVLFAVTDKDGRRPKLWPCDLFDVLVSTMQRWYDVDEKEESSTDSM